jgi:hypothetical protein
MEMEGHEKCALCFKSLVIVQVRFPEHEPPAGTYL